MYHVLSGSLLLRLVDRLSKAKATILLHRALRCKNSLCIWIEPAREKGRKSIFFHFFSGIGRYGALLLAPNAESLLSLLFSVKSNYPISFLTWPWRAIVQNRSGRFPWYRKWIPARLHANATAVTFSRLYGAYT